jgi:hypothetical protein
MTVPYVNSVIIFTAAKKVCKLCIKWAFMGATYVMTFMQSFGDSFAISFVLGRQQ